MRPNLRDQAVGRVSSGEDRKLPPHLHGNPHHRLQVCIPQRGPSPPAEARLLRPWYPPCRLHLRGHMPRGVLAVHLPLGWRQVAQAVIQCPLGDPHARPRHRPRAQPRRQPRVPVLQVVVQPQRTHCLESRQGRPQSPRESLRAALHAADRGDRALMPHVSGDRVLLLKHREVQHQAVRFESRVHPVHLNGLHLLRPTPGEYLE